MHWIVPLLRVMPSSLRLDGSFVMAGNFLGALDLRSHTLGTANMGFDLYLARLQLIP